MGSAVIAARDKVEFPEASHSFGAPPDLSESQVMTIAALVATIDRGSLEGSRVIITKWIPSPEDKLAIMAGAPVYLSVIGGGLPPHMITLDIHSALNPA